jgi:glycosyltransferase involved in cell wall biosynthesis
MNPKVTFVVPCYRMAHLLPDCVNSILSQTYRDFEVLIMDDCSPDHTPEVAASFNDARITHIRNENNLGHLRNFNKGIGLSRGRYVWLISADDYLRRPYVLERYVQLMDRRPNVGYVFCPAVGLLNGNEAGTLEYSRHGDRDTIFDGRQFVRKLVYGNTVVAASGMVRKECYEKSGTFPLDMPWAHDWYLWNLFALHFDVGYFSEPMVCYREHERSMTTALMKGGLLMCAADDLSLPWLVKRKAEEIGQRSIAEDCLQALSIEYARQIATKSRYRTSTTSLMSLEQFEESLARHSSDAREKKLIRAKVYRIMADLYGQQGELSLARRFYRLSARNRGWSVKLCGEQLLLVYGDWGSLLREQGRRFRQKWSSARADQPIESKGSTSAPRPQPRASRSTTN